MASLKANLGFVPNTDKYEKAKRDLEQEYYDFLSFGKSDELKEYKELEGFISSVEYAQKRKDIMAQKFNQTDEYQKETEYKRLKKSKEIKHYYQIKDAEQLKTYEAFQHSGLLRQYNELKDFVAGEEYKKAKQYMSLPPAKRYEDTGEYQKETRYLELKKQPDVTAYLKFAKNKGLDDFLKTHGSDRLKEVQNLKDFVASGDFNTKKSSMKKKEFRETEEYKKFSRYNELLKSPEIKSYHRLIKNPGAKEYLAMHGSEKVAEFNELKNYVESAEFKALKKKIIKKEFKDTPEYAKEKELKALEKNKEIKTFFAFGSSSLYSNYNKYHESEEIKQFEELEAFINSEDFKKVREYMALPPKKKFEASEEYAKKTRYDELKKSEKISWYKKLTKINKFEGVDCWEETFFDDFSSSKLEPKKWMTRYFWGDYLLKEPFSLANDKHFVTDGENIRLENNTLKIVTKKEKITGMAWDNRKNNKNNPWEVPLGFFHKEFEYTSGLISTAKSFRQKYGCFEAKVRFSGPLVTHAFWMVSDLMVPHVDIAKLDKKLQMNNFWDDAENGQKNRNLNRLFSSKYKNGYFIYSLEWTAEKLTWKINGVEVDTKTTGVPQDTMYIVFSSGIYRNINENSLPAQMDIDWVRCYQYKD